MYYKLFLLVILILNVNLTNAVFLLEVKESALDRLIEELWPHLQNQLTQTIDIPDQKVVKGIKLKNLKVDLDLPNRPIMTLDAVRNRSIMNIKNVSSEIHAKLKIGIFAEEVSFFLRLNSIGVGFSVVHKNGNLNDIQTIIEFDHTDVDCESLNVKFMSGTINWVFNKVWNNSLIGIKKHVCKFIRNFIKDKANKFAQEMIDKDMKDRANEFLPMELPISKRDIMRIEVAEAIKIVGKSQVIPLRIESRKVDGTMFEKSCNREDFRFFPENP